ncbi:MAG TPA: tetratricopeptide repeat protein [Anaeromyxobacter sp.]|nr:tetratricopeptide repeat protein [Anaeromyxobacter sp.]
MTVLTLALILRASLAVGEPGTPAPGAAPASAAPAAPAATTAPATASAPSSTPPPVTAIPPQIPMVTTPSAAVAEKLAQGDRAFAGGDLRGALFAYLDAVYAQPAYIFARVKLGRAYLALRYPARAIEQAEKVLAADPGNAEAARLVQDAKAPLARPATAAAPAAQKDTPRVYRLTPNPEAAPAAGPARGPKVEIVAQPASGSARQSYLQAIELIGRQDYAGAIEALDEAIASDPRLAPAYAARASARFGLRRYREAADDYKAALGLDGSTAMPLYGLGECYRLLGDPAAAQMYERYAASHASDVREDLRGIAAERAKELSRR